MRINLNEAINEIKAWSKEHPLGSQDGLGKDAVVGFVVQSDYNPNIIWIVEEVGVVSKANVLALDFFGYANVNDDTFAKFGYVSLEELLSVENMLGLKYDDTCKGKTIVETMKQYEQKVPDWLLEEPSLD